MPPAPTIAQCFRDAGCQAFCVGKLHVVFPLRDRIGYDDVLPHDRAVRPDATRLLDFVLSDGASAADTAHRLYGERPAGVSRL